MGEGPQTTWFFKVLEMTSWVDGLRLFLLYSEFCCTAIEEGRGADEDWLEGWRPEQNLSGQQRAVWCGDGALTQVGKVLLGASWYVWDCSTVSKLLLSGGGEASVM